MFYSERLVSLLREVRQLTALGFPIPRNIRACADDAQKFYRHAVALKQVANFYNTIGTQIIPSQKLMMLQFAMDFEDAVKKPRGRKGGEVQWADVREVEAFVSLLQQKEHKVPLAPLPSALLCQMGGRTDSGLCLVCLALATGS